MVTAKKFGPAGPVLRPDVVLARTTPKEEVSRPTEGLSVFLIDLQELRGNGLKFGQTKP
ncbi:MAG: hypothetical protein Ct9H300mP14_16880 [Gammaproteobacteria bacterium]|nr:MAG: hypothetical protein Ct9H300mP14_16880 [Gammaproteobacteria bacterium]